MISWRPFRLAGFVLAVVLAPCAVQAQTEDDIVVFDGAVTGADTAGTMFNVTLYAGDAGYADFIDTRILVASSHTDPSGHYLILAPKSFLGPHMTLTLVARNGSRPVNGVDGAHTGGQIVIQYDASNRTTNTIAVAAISDTATGIANNRYASSRFFYITDRARQGDQFGNVPSPGLAPTMGTFGGHVALASESVLPASECKLGTAWKCPVTKTRADNAYIDAITADASGQASVVSYLTGLKLPKPTGNRIVVFVHGYNTGFEEAAQTLVQLAYEAGQDFDAGILVSWPSLQQPLSYPGDQTAIKTSLAKNGAAVFNGLAALGANNDVTIVAHSLGTYFVTNGLAQFGAAHPGAAPAFRRLAIFAGDIESDDFKLALPDLHRAVGAIRVYGSSADQALRASRCFNKTSRRRLGQPPPTYIPPPAYVDETANAPRAGWGHGYLTASLVTAADFAAFVHDSAAPDVTPLRGLPWLGGVESGFAIPTAPVLSGTVCFVLKGSG